jgi:hypothetical protein
VVHRVAKSLRTTVAGRRDLQHFRQNYFKAFFSFDSSCILGDPSFPLALGLRFDVKITGCGRFSRIKVLDRKDRSW